MKLSPSTGRNGSIPVVRRPTSPQPVVLSIGEAATVMRGAEPGEHVRLGHWQPLLSSEARR